jgi:citrate synthase
MNRPPADGEYLHTWIGQAQPDAITIAGLDLPSEVMGHLSLTELALLLVTRRMPDERERRLADAVLVSLADHGFTPTALAARLTFTGAPEAPQGAIAAGILGAGSVFLGPAGDTAQFLADALADLDPADRDDDERLARCAADAVERRRAEGARVPGIGHPLHREADPRTERLYELAEADGLLGPHLRLLRAVAAANEAASGRSLPINGAGAGGAALADLGLSPDIVRAFVLIARTAGLVGHLAEEQVAPIGMPLWQEVERRAAQTGES